MPGNPKFDQFHFVKIAPKFKKSRDRNHNQISSDGGQDTAAYHISGISLYVFSTKCLETQNFTRFTKSN